MKRKRCCRGLVVLLAFIVGPIARSGHLSAGDALGPSSSEPVVKRLYPVVLRGHVGFIDQKGRVAVDAKFDRLPPEDRWRLDTLLPGHQPLARALAIPHLGMHEYFAGFHGGICVVCRDQKLGFLRQDGKLLVEPQFEQVTNFHDGAAWGCTAAKCALVSDEGRVLLSGFSRFAPYSEGLAAVQRDERWGFVDRYGVFHIPPKFQFIGCRFCPPLFPEGGEFVDGLAQVWENEKTGLIDRSGEFVVPPKYEGLQRLPGGFAFVQTGGRWALTGPAGKKLLTPFLYDQSGRAGGEGLLTISIEKKEGCIDYEGQLRIPAQFDYVGPFHDGMATIAAGKHWGYIDRLGKVIIKPQYAEADDFRDGVAQVRMASGKYGLINRTGEFVVRPKYDHLGRFACGLAVVCVDQRWGAIDRSGNLVIDTVFDELRQFARGCAVVRSRGKCGVVDTSGQFLIRPMFDWVDEQVVDGFRVFQDNGKFGYSDARGNVLIAPRFDFAERFSGGIARVGMGVRIAFGWDVEGGKWGYIDTNGSWIWQPTD